tara:strand:- start:777 stop:1256 length:480 start_codon:yes stop_codon:yes gene_type:complete
MEIPVINNLFELMDCIQQYEPNLINYIMDFVFIPCDKGDYEYVRALPEKKKSKSIIFDAFKNIKNLKMVIIDKSVNSIGEGTFQNCTGLTSVFIPDSVTFIGKCAFYGCSELTSVFIPDSVTSIGYRAFYGCSGLTEVFIPEEAFSGIRMHHIKIPKPF